MLLMYIFSPVFHSRFVFYLLRFSPFLTLSSNLLKYVKHSMKVIRSQLFGFIAAWSAASWEMSFLRPVSWCDWELL